MTAGHPLLQTGVPWLTSLALHGGLILVGILGYREMPKLFPPLSREQIIIPEMDLGNSTPMLPGKPNEKNLGMFSIGEDIPIPTEARNASPAQSERLGTILAGSMGNMTGEPGVIGVQSNLGTGFRQGKWAGGGGGRDGVFGTPVIGPSRGPSFWDIRFGNVTRCVYVCDASGSMLNKFEYLRDEILVSVDKLKLIHGFNIVFFQDGPAMSLSRVLMPGTPDNKTKVKQFLSEVSCRGSTDPIPGLKVAFDQNPQLIFLLTDGDFTDNAAVENYIRMRNKDHRVKINTIAFFNRDGEGEQILRRIAEENGGRFRQVSAE